MGFDLYGLKPYNPDGVERPDYLDWSEKPSEEEKEDYFEAVNAYEKKVIGHYFRNNVWWWRPLWNFVTTACDDFLTENDIDRGSFNDGHKISKTKSIRIAARIRKLDKTGVLDGYASMIDGYIKKAEKNNKKLAVKKETLKKKVQKITGTEHIIPMDYPEPYRATFEKLMDQEDRGGHYPFKADNVRDFAEFCHQSGGFEIC